MDEDTQINEGSTEGALDLEPATIEGYAGPMWLYALERLKRFLVGVLLLVGAFLCVNKYLGAVIAAGDLTLAQTVVVAILQLVGSVCSFYFVSHKSQAE